jgi:hypothetical protein
MTTTANFVISPTLLEKLTGSSGGTTSGNANGAYVYIYVFQGDGTQVGSTVTLVSNGNYQPANLAVTLNPGGANLTGGNIVVVTQQAGTATPTHAFTPLTELPSSTPDLNTIGFFTEINGTTHNFRWDKIEFTISGTSSDVADLTNIVQFGAPMEIKITYGQGAEQTIDTRGYNAKGEDIVQSLANLSPPNTQDYPWSPLANSLLDDQRMTLSLANNVVDAQGNNPLNVASDWKAYVEGFQSNYEDVRIAAFFNGVAATSTKPAQPAQLSYYEVAFQDDTFWLVPVEINGIPTTNYVIGIPVSDLESNIYTQTGHLRIYDKAGGTLVKEYTDSFTPNNAYGNVAKYFVAGFDAGFWGGSANSINPQVGGRIDLNQTWNWSAAYAYQATVTGDTYGYTNSIGMGSGTVGAADRQMFYDPFGGYFLTNTNAYGYSYSDLVSNGGGVNPGISLWDSSLNANVQSISITLFDHSDTPTGYKAPSLPYVAATSNVTQLFHDLQMIFDTRLASPVLPGGFAYPTKNTPVYFRFNTADGFVSLQLLNPNPGHEGEYWGNFVIENNGGTWTANYGGSNDAGYIIINGLPATADPSQTGWYQFQIGDGEGVKLYNIYMKANNSAVTFALMDGGSGAQASLVSGQPTQVKFVLASGGDLTFDPALFALSGSPPTPTQSLPGPMVGSSTGGVFTSFGSLADIKQGGFAFHSTNDGTIIGGDIAKLSFTHTLNMSWTMTPLIAQSNVDGEWLTKMVSHFGNGTYTAFMEQYRMVDWGLTNAVGQSSMLVTFTVNLDTLHLVPVGGGTALGLDAGTSSTEGNWIQLTTTRSTLPNGTLIAYATDTNGSMIARDGSITMSLDAATIGRIGSVASDSGGTFFNGQQSVYLSVGHELRFAIVAGNGVVDINPSVTVTGLAPTLAVTISNAYGTIDLSAQVNNTLNRDETLAASQRLSDTAWLYVTQGTNVKVDLAWSGVYVNTLYFVRIDVDPADASHWKVGGVDFGNTSAFRGAVQSNWEFISTQGGSTGTSSTTWAVSGQSGFYAPVLVNPFGNIWMINNGSSNANSDGHQHVRIFGQNTFGFEDMHAAAGADFDYNDMIMKLTVL